MRFVFGFFVIFLISVMPASARDIGPGIGQAIPHALEALDQNEQAQSFESLTGEKGMVLVFVRSLDWCPYCQAQMIELGEQAGEITDKGYSLVALSYDAPAKLKKFADKYEFEYPMLSDEDSEAIQAFGILNEEMEKGTRFYGIPHPAVFIISKQGIIQNKFFEENYKDRPQVEAIMTALEALR